MSDTQQLTELDSGLRVVSERIDTVRSVALGFWIRTGSRDETVAEAGVSHFLEHLLFKGTDRFSSTEIDQIFDGMGAEINAGTGKETTSVYSRFLDQHFERAFDVMSDMVLRPSYPDIDSERQVVIEEIAMYEDEPSDKVHDVLAQAVFGDHPLGRPVIGRAEVIADVPVPEIAAYHDERYSPSNLVLAAAGNVDHDQLVALAQKACEGKLPSSNGKRDLVAAPAGADPRMCFFQKQTEQFHVTLGAPGIKRGDERRFALRVLDTILGGSTSSRLFQEVREKRGLAYAVYSYSSQYLDSGQIGMYVGTRPDNVPEALTVIGDELRKLREDGVSADELERAKENVKGRTVLSMESMLARMNRLGSSLLTGIPLLSLDDVLARTDAVTADDIAALVTELYDRSVSPQRPSAATRTSSSAPSRQSTRSSSPLDQRRRLRRRGEDGAGGLRGRRGCRRHGAGRAGGSAARRLVAGRAGRRRRRCRLHAAGHGAAQRHALPRGRCALRHGHDRRRLLAARGRREWQPVRGAELRDRRGDDDGSRAADRQAHARGRDHRAAPRSEEGRAVGDR